MRSSSRCESRFEAPERKADLSLSNAMESYILGLILNGTAIPGFADNAASGPLTSLYIALYTADPGETGSTTTNEASFAGYARAAIARPGWTASGTTQY